MTIGDITIPKTLSRKFKEYSLTIAGTRLKKENKKRGGIITHMTSHRKTSLAKVEQIKKEHYDKENKEK